MPSQPHILGPCSPHSLFVTLGLDPAHPGDPRGALARLAAAVDPARTVVGLGPALAHVPGLAALPALSGPGVHVPSTQGALWLALYDGDPGELLHEARRLIAVLGGGFTVSEQVAAYQHREGRDLSGYLDGTANPVEAAAEAAAIQTGALAGGSFALFQRWVHDLGALDALGPAGRDATLGRRLLDNEEIADAPESAHVKRTAQEEVGFLLRRSQPWGDLGAHGLAFLAYAADPEVFLAHLRRMTGAEDGTVDALFRVSRPLSGGLYWCPPLRDGALDLRALA